MHLERALGNAWRSRETTHQGPAAVRSYVPERVKDGVFGAMMNVRLENDGPVTVVLDSNDRE